MADTHAIPDTHGDAAADHHIGWKKYVVIGVILTLITGIEVAVFYIDALAPVLVPVLLTLSTAKFVLVVLYYMHLRFDNPIFGRVFWLPLLLAMMVVIGMVILFKVLPAYGVFS